MKIQTTLVLIMLSLLSTAEAREFTSEEFVLLTSANAIDRLHRLKLKEVESVEESLAHELMYDAISLARAVSKDSSENNIRIRKHLTLIAVMNEKFEIPLWRNNKEFQAMLEKSLHYLPEYTEKLRCQDWDSPMWQGQGICT